MQVLCPTCKKQIEWNDKFPYRPFCSERCKLIDLGAWADGSYSIPDESVDPSELSSHNDDEDQS